MFSKVSKGLEAIQKRIDRFTFLHEQASIFQAALELNSPIISVLGCIHCEELDSLDPMCRWEIDDPMNRVNKGLEMLMMR